MGRVVGGIGALVVLAVVAVVLLRDSTMTVHERVPVHSILFVEGRASSRSTSDRTQVLTHALASQCVAETADRSAVTSFSWRSGNRFVMEVRPSLDAPDQRQLRGCLSDFRMPRLLVRVVRMRATV
jgi:hypothetical protein